MLLARGVSVTLHVDPAQVTKGGESGAGSREGKAGSAEQGVSGKNQIEGDMGLASIAITSEVQDASGLAFPSPASCAPFCLSLWPA